MSDNAFNEKAGLSQVGSFVFSLDKVCSGRVSHCRHPSIRTLDERLFRSVQVGRSRFSRCCHLLGDLYFISKDAVGPGVRRSHRNSASWFLTFLSPEMFLWLCCDRQRTWLAIVQRFVHFCAYPQVMQQHRQLPCRGNDGTFLPVPSTTLGQLQSPSSYTAVRTEWP